MDTDLIGWLTLLFASLVTLWILIEIGQGKTNAFVHRGFFETVGGEEIRRSENPIHFWFMIAIRSMGVIALWLLWYACWYVH